MDAPRADLHAPMPDQITGTRRGGRHGSRQGPDDGRAQEAPTRGTGARGRRGRRGQPEQAPAPDGAAPLGRDVVLGRGAPPGRGTAPGRGVPPGQAMAPGQAIPPGQDAPKGRGETNRRPLPGGPAGRRRAPGWDEAAVTAQDADIAAPPAEFEEPDGTRLGGRRSRRRGGDRQAAPDPVAAGEQAGRGSRAARSGSRASKRRARTLVLAVVVVVVLAAGAVAALKFLQGGSGRSHVLVAPSRLGSYVRRPQLEQQMNAKVLQQQVIAKSAGQASHVVSAVYENTAGVSGSAPPQIFLFIGGNLAGESPAGFVSSFTAQFKGAAATSPGSLGGQAACVDARGSAAGSVALCTWADGDTFGVVASPTMGLSQLAAQMRAIRPSVERPAR